MKKSLIAILVLSSLSLASLALAQDGGGAPRGDCRGGRGHHGRHFSPEAMERRLTHLTERLSLDEHQVTLVREIFVAARAEGEALRATERSPERRAAFHALMESVGTRIDAVLNETQRAQFAAMRAERRARHEGRRERREERREERGVSRGI